jgi:hypothetical protein
VKKKLPDIRMIDGRRMQCKDIPDDLFIGAVLITAGFDGTVYPGSWRFRFDVKETLEDALGHIPEKLFLAKALKLMEARKLSGCPCGCRGDYHIPCGRETCYEYCTPKQVF